MGKQRGPRSSGHNHGGQLTRFQNKGRLIDASTWQRKEMINGHLWNLFNGGSYVGDFIDVVSQFYQWLVHPTGEKAFPSPPETGKERLIRSFVGNAIPLGEQPIYFLGPTSHFFPFQACHASFTRTFTGVPDHFQAYPPHPYFLRKHPIAWKIGTRGGAAAGPKEQVIFEPGPGSSVFIAYQSFILTIDNLKC